LFGDFLFLIQHSQGWSYRQFIHTVTRKGHVKVRAFAAVPTLADLPEILQEPGSASNVSSFRGADGRVDLAEGYILTKSVKYTHRVVHWVNAVCSGDPVEAVSRKLIGVYSPQLLKTRIMPGDTPSDV
jgi:hypothetical protein